MAKKTDPKNWKLDEEEQRLMAEYEASEPRKASVEVQQMMKDAADATRERINFRISGGDLSLLRKIADEEGIGYQTLISSVLHKYVTGKLIEARVVELSDDRINKAIGPLAELITSSKKSAKQKAR